VVGPQEKSPYLVLLKPGYLERLTTILAVVTKSLFLGPKNALRRYWPLKFEYRQRLWQYQMNQAISHRRSCWDNAPIEDGFRVLISE
jgi:hypothetical protein